jgi:hypothetical protein
MVDVWRAFVSQASAGPKSAAGQIAPSSPGLYDHAKQLGFELSSRIEAQIKAVRSEGLI